METTTNTTPGAAVPVREPARQFSVGDRIPVVALGIRRMGLGAVQWTCDFRAALEMGAALIHVQFQEMTVLRIDCSKVANDREKAAHRAMDSRGRRYLYDRYTPEAPVKSLYTKATWLAGHDHRAYVFRPDMPSTVLPDTSFVWVHHLLSGVQAMALDTFLQGIEYTGLRVVRQAVISGYVQHAQTHPGQRVILDPQRLTQEGYQDTPGTDLGASWVE